MLTRPPDQVKNQLPLLCLSAVVAKKDPLEHQRVILTAAHKQKTLFDFKLEICLKPIASQPDSCWLLCSAYMQAKYNLFFSSEAQGHQNLFKSFM